MTNVIEFKQIDRDTKSYPLPFPIGAQSQLVVNVRRFLPDAGDLPPPLVEFWISCGDEKTQPWPLMDCVDGTFLDETIIYPSLATVVANVPAVQFEL